MNPNHCCALNMKKKTQRQDIKLPSLQLHPYTLLLAFTAFP